MILDTCSCEFTESTFHLVPDELLLALVLSTIYPMLTLVQIKLNVFID